MYNKRGSLTSRLKITLHEFIISFSKPYIFVKINDLIIIK